MNERIKLLAEQADIVFGFDKNGDPEVICAAMDIEKFAELIIQDLINSMIHRYGDDDELPIEEIKLFAKEHFGVGE